jgi:uncharacterized protein (DUF58 family)
VNVTATLPTSQTRARQLGDALPPLVVRAERIAATVLQGSHGLRRAGVGENFWAYRPYGFGDSAQRIDWRKSAKTDEPFIKDNEWQTVNTLWLWVNLGPRMKFMSHLATEPKQDQAQVLGLALAALSLRAHERVGLLGNQARASFGRDVLSRIAFTMTQGNDGDLPAPSALQRRSTALIISDFLEEPEALRHRLRLITESGMRGHLLQVTDPAEESLPYAGRMDFLGLDVQARFKAGKAQNLRAEYVKAFQHQRAEVQAIARQLGFSFQLHHTDQSLSATVLRLYQRIGAK